MRRAKRMHAPHARRDFGERFEGVEAAITYFNRFSEGLYSEPGILSIDVLLIPQKSVQKKQAFEMMSEHGKTICRARGLGCHPIWDKGYGFNVEIKRARSQGIGYMKVFCYDLTLVRLFSDVLGEPGFLIHDSTIFDGVDERQIAKALELAAFESKARDIQYICALNSDNVPDADFGEAFKSDFEKHVIITFTDATDDGGLLGIRF